jgi:LysM domain.
MATTNPDGTITVQAGDTLSGLYGSDWQAQSGYTGDPTKLQIGTVLPAPSSNVTTPTPLPSAINSSQLSPAQTPTIPTGTNTPNTYVPPNLAGAPLQSLTQSEQNALNAKDSGANNLVALYGSLTGESKALTDAYNSEDITGLKKTLQDYNNQILTKTAELQQYDVQDQQYQANIEKQAVPLGVVVGQQAEQARQSAITRSSKVAEIGLLNSQVLATQGNIELATKTAEEAVAAKYAPIKEQIAIQEAQLKAIEPLLTTAEKKIADNQQLAVDTYKEKLKTQEELSLYNAKLGIDNAAINSGVAGYVPTAPSSYTIKSSDLSAPYSELYSVAKAAGVDLQTLKDLNPGLVEGKIKAGDVVNLPVAGSTKDLNGAIQSIATSIVQKNLRNQFLNQATALSRSNNVVGLKDLIIQNCCFYSAFRRIC